MKYLICGPTLSAWGEKAGSQLCVCGLTDRVDCVSGQRVQLQGHNVI